MWNTYRVEGLERHETYYHSFRSTYWYPKTLHL